MFKLNLKIALRNLWKNKGYTAINIGGLAIGLAGFILVMLYVNYETAFDKWNPNYKQIYIVGRTVPGMNTPLTAPPLAPAIAAQCPEVEAVGRISMSSFEIPFFSNNQMFVVKKMIAVDYSIAKMYGIEAIHGLQEPKGAERLLYLTEKTAAILFPNEKDIRNKVVNMGSKNGGFQFTIAGVIKSKQSNLDFEAISLMGKEAISGQGYGYPNYVTSIQVKPGTDIKALENKIDRLYKNGIAQEFGKGGNDESTSKARVIYLDPLANQHLKPAYGSDTNYKIVWAISILAILILVIACINFTNLSIAQASKRAREVGMKKVFGAYRINLIMQFLGEIFIQCLMAMVLAFVMAELFMPAFNGLFKTELSLWNGNAQLIWQLSLVLLVITLLAGVYPAFVLSGYIPAKVLKGNMQTSYRTLWFRNALLISQFVIAIVFIAGLLIINGQVQYMKTMDTGLKTDQVVYLKNMAVFNKPESFKPVREKIMAIPGVKSVTVATNIPGGQEPGKNDYTIQGKTALLDIVDVDFDYFETLKIKLKEGRTFSQKFSSDTLNAVVLNEAAAQKFGDDSPVGKTIHGCSSDYKVIGVVKNFKTAGFEKPVEPAVYSIKDPCGNMKIEIMVSIESDKMGAVIASIKDNWASINTKDHETFRYEFLDQVYGRLFVKQEQLRTVFFAFAILTIFIAVLGLFAFAAYTISNRYKEIAIRKVLGASDGQVLVLFNRSFIFMVAIANIVAWPVAWYISHKWLEGFAYRIEMPIMPFIIAGVGSLLITILTVSIQARKATVMSPVEALKCE